MQLAPALTAPHQRPPGAGGIAKGARDVDDAFRAFLRQIVGEEWMEAAGEQ